ncbi:MAG: hypothetical protein HN572_06170, partial [Kordiimonadaceae bacterium]|nr:hypothetical protein [Kordiimonadaceae bacterium]
STQVGTVFSKAGTYGALNLDSSTNQWTYIVDNTDADTQALGAGSALNDSFQVVANDGLNTQNQAITITVQGTNDNPTAISLAGTKTVAENALGAVIGQVTVDDIDTGDTHKITLSGADSDKYEVSTTNQLQLKSGVSADFEAQKTHQLTLTATDTSQASVSQALVITVVDQNDAPSDIALSSNVVVENNTGATVGILSATDQDVGDTATFSLVNTGGTDYGSFVIDGSLLKLKTAISADFESKESYSLDVKVLDSGNNSYTERLTINVTDLNESPTAINLSQTTIDDKSTGAGTISVVDIDSQDSHTLTLSGTDKDLFTLDGSTLSLKTAADFDLKNSYSFSITAKDLGENVLTQAFALNVIEVNVAPTDITLGGTTVAENNTGATIGQLTTTDADIGDSHSYTIGGTDSAAFVIDGSFLKLNSTTAADFEIKPSYSITLTTKDSDDETYSEAFTVSVTDTAEAPSAINLTSTVLNENSAGGTVGIISVTDSDAGETHTLTLTGTDKDLFEVVEVSGQKTLKLKAGQSADYETKNSYSLGIKAVDKDGLSLSQDVVVNVANVNETPTDIALSGLNLVENSAQGTVVGTLSGTDPDSGDSLNYAITGGTGAAFFEINANNEVVVKTGAVVDFETLPAPTLTIRTTDAGSLTYDETFTLSVTGVNEAPTSVSLSANSVAENSSAGTVLGNLTTVDPEGDTTSLSLVGGTGASNFDIDNNQLVVKTGAN